MANSAGTKQGQNKENLGTGVIHQLVCLKITMKTRINTMKSKSINVSQWNLKI